MPPSGRAIKVAVVGHVEWVEFACVQQMPWPGEIVDTRDLFQEPAGGGAVAAVQLARLAGEALLVSALGEDRLAGAARDRLKELGVRLRSAPRPGPTRRALTLVDDQEHERTIVTLGERLAPSGEDSELPWRELAEMDAVYFTAGDLPALRAARAARVLVASPRAGSVLGHGVPLDALVLSRGDSHELEGAARWQGAARVTVRTEGARGGAWWRSQGGVGRPRSSWAPAEVPGPLVDSYGCGDSFAAGLTYGLARGWEPAAAVALAARCGATCLAGRGPYRRQLTRAEIPS